MHIFNSPSILQIHNYKINSKIKITIVLKVKWMDKNKSFMYRLDLNRFDTWYLDLLEQTLLSQAHLYKPRDIIQKIMKNKFIFNRWLNRKLFPWNNLGRSLPTFLLAEDFNWSRFHRTNSRVKISWELYRLERLKLYDRLYNETSTYRINLLLNGLKVSHKSRVKSLNRHLLARNRHLP